MDAAIGEILEHGKSPGRKIGELDNRGSHFYLALYWAQALAKQDKDKELKARFGSIAKSLADNEAKIAGELSASQGKPQDIGGYYMPIEAKANAALRPSHTLNGIINAM